MSHRRVRVLAIILLPIFLASCGSDGVRPPSVSYRTVRAEYGVLGQEYAVTANIEGKKTTSLAFKTSGRIAEITAEIGSRVRAGQVLAVLSNEEQKIAAVWLGTAASALEWSAKSAQEAVSAGIASRSALDRLYTARIGLSREQEKRADIAVSLAAADLDLARSLEVFGANMASGTFANAGETLLQAEKNLDLARTNYDAGTRVLSGTLAGNTESVKQAEKNLDLAQNQLANTRKVTQASLETTRKNGLSALAGAYFVVRSARDFIDRNLGATGDNTQTNRAIASYLGAKDSTLKEAAKASFLAFDAKYAEMRAWYETNIDGKPDATIETVTQGLTNGLAVTDSLRQALHDFASVLEASITSSWFSDADLQALKAQNTTHLSALETAILSPTWGGMKGSLEAINTAQAQERLTISQLEDAVALARGNLTLARNGNAVGASSTDRSRAELANNLSLAESQLRAAQNGRAVSQDQARQTLATLRTNVITKEGALQSMKSALDTAKMSTRAIETEYASKRAEADANVANAGFQLGQAEANRSQTAMNRDLAEQTLRSGVIVAPYDGIITAKYAESGKVVAAGAPVFAISEEAHKVVRIAVDLSQYPLKIGDTVAITRNSDGKTLSGAVSLATTNVDPALGKNAVEVSAPSDFAVGESVTIGVRMTPLGSGAISPTVIVPLDAIVSRYGPPGVFVLSGNVVRFVPMRILATNAVRASVDGVGSGAMIVTQGKDLLLDGQAIR